LVDVGFIMKNFDFSSVLLKSHWVMTGHYE
jgi:hypothetical protein